MKYPAFLGGSYVAQAPTADYEETINYYLEVLESEGATSRLSLLPTPGVLNLAEKLPDETITAMIKDVGSGPGRAHFAMDGAEYAVFGTSFCTVTETGVLQARGTVALGDDPATICSNGDAGGQIFITSGGNGYLYTPATTTFAAIGALAGKATMGDYLDGYFLALDANTSMLYISALFDGSSWSTSTDFAQRSLGADPWLSMKVVGRYIWLFGEQTSEVWEDTGATFPFAPAPSGFILWGIAAPFSAAVLGEAVIWLGQDRAGRVCVIRGEGFTPNVISHFPFELAVRDYVRISDAFGEAYSDLGHSFYLISFDTAAVTWAWDDGMRLWSKRGTWLQEKASYESWYPRFHAYAYNEHRILNSRGSFVYKLGPEFRTDIDDRMIRRVRRAPAIMNENRRVFYASFELDMEVGLGEESNPADVQSDNPQVILRISNDGGKTWISEQYRPAGKAGEYFRRVRWNRLGAARRRVFEVVVTDPIPWRLTGCYLETVDSGKAA